jgi:3-oxoacyl-[acyl-carrier-protein] synthase-3
MSRSALLAVGHYLPPLVQRAGVTRPIEDPPPGTSEIGARASRAALEGARIDPLDVDFIIFATINPDVPFPGAACYMQDKLGCGTVGALDVRAQCAGFVCGLMVADQFVRNGQYRRVLVVGAELHSTWVDYSPTGVELARLFGDGGGAVVLGPDGGDRGVLSAILHSDGSRHDRFWCEYPASRQHPLRITKENIRAGKHFPWMDERDVRAFGQEKLPAVVRQAVEQAGLSLDHIDHFVLSHVLPDVAADSAAALGVAAERTTVPSATYGHLGAAALPVALSEGIQAGKIKEGSTVCLAAAGAGYAWGAAVLHL